VKKLLGITLGIMTALGGFVDLGQIVFTMQAGALFSYSLLWVIVLGTIAIIVYMEMCGRVAVVAREPVFSTVRNRLGFRLGLMTLIASNLLNLLTCAAELAGVAILLHLLTGWPERALMVFAAVAFAVIIAALKFEPIERIFGLSGKGNGSTSAGFRREAAIAIWLLRSGNVQCIVDGVRSSLLLFRGN
jgi:manganese transport protein